MIYYSLVPLGHVVRPGDIFWWSTRETFEQAVSVQLLVSQSGLMPGYEALGMRFLRRIKLG
jgi:hypothetical protein